MFCLKSATPETGSPGIQPCFYPGCLLRKVGMFKGQTHSVLYLDLAWWVWWLMPAIPALRRLRLEECCMLKVSLRYRARLTQKNPEGFWFLVF